MATIHLLPLAPLLLLLTAAFLSTEITAQLDDAPGPEPAGPINIMSILRRGGQFATFIRILNTTQIGNQINTQVNTSSDGMTVFAPTDNAFQNLKPGTLNKLSPGDQVNLVLYHVTPRFYSLEDLLSVSNPVSTQASGREAGGVYGLNITGQVNQVNVSTGVIETRLSNALRDDRPLAVYVVDMVLLPEEMFGERKISPVPAPAPKSSNSTDLVDDDVSAPGASRKAATPPPAVRSGSGKMKSRFGFGLGLGLVVFCLNFLF